MAEPSAKDVRPNRTSRQRQKTRERLIGAALSVMAHKGVDAATINNITEAADLGFGSFYNYFESKEEIVWAALDALFDRIGARIDTVAGSVADPLQALSSALRIFIGLIIAKPEWAGFVLRVCTMPGFTKVGLFARLYRDIRAAHEAGRLRLVDPELVPHSVGGAMLFLVVALQEGDLPPTEAPVRIAAMVLRILGVDEAEIARLVNLPLPQLTDKDACLYLNGNG